MSVKARVSKLEGALSNDAMKARFGDCDLSFLADEEHKQLADIYRSVKPGCEPSLPALSWSELQLLKRVSENLITQGSIA